MNAGKGYAFDRQTDRQTGRNIYLDIVKYVAIFLVIWGHVVQQSLDPGVVPVRADEIYRFIYSFHMPLFMGISGYFFGKSVHKIKGPLLYVKRKLHRRILGLVIPMISFGLLKCLTDIAWGLDITPITIVKEVIGIWFLGMVLINTLIVLGMAIFCNGTFKHDCKYFMIGIIFTVISKLEYGSFNGFFMYVFFVSGYCIATYLNVSQIQKARFFWKIALINFIFAYFIYNNLPWPLGHIEFNLHSLPLAHIVTVASLKFILGFLGSYLTLIGIYFLLPYIQRLSVFREASQAGRYTLDIYLIQILLVERICGPWYRQMVDKIGFNYILQNGVLFEIAATFLIALIFLHVIIWISKLLNRSSICSKILFYRDSPVVARGKIDV